MIGTDLPANKPVRTVTGRWLIGAVFLALLSACGSEGDADNITGDGIGVGAAEKASHEAAASGCALDLIGICVGGTGGTGNDGGSGGRDVVGAADSEEPSSQLAGPPALPGDGLYQACAGAARSLRNPFGLGRRQWESSSANRAFLGSIWPRAEAIQAATSQPVRVVFHQPGGWFLAAKDGMRGALPTIHVMNGRKRDGSKLYPWRWAVWADELATVAATHPDWILGVYFSGQVPTQAAQDAVDAQQGWEVYDHDIYRHRTLMMRVVDQWLAVGVREFFLDSSQSPYYGEDMPELAAAIRARGGRMFVEGHPRDSQNNLRFDFLEQIDGSIATHRFMVDREPQSSNWVVPDGSVMMVMLSDTLIPDAPHRSTPSWSDVVDYRERGFTILSGHEAFDHFISDAATAD